ncbi:alpha/beta hydrolase [Herbiconiux sp. KACC 21604]|uniref:alpha/beta hydrolase n=1 Tax=unclassified Herbiconiux TaxID=2618217 RepID=UPI001492A71C|nr:alpha/beta hydrolase [Herbiconiux sp. SALV-R1]QJU54515.1 alpha/beta fold hydrolase [Herbiconiux sp. SALV-R1]WPO85598.1 alpha/beta hydrolase [Herbiconiux sp. KACC 21604]
MRTASRTGALAAVVLATALALSGCVTWFVDAQRGGSPSAPTTSTPTAEDVPADLQRFYGQVLEWQPCSGSFLCTTAIAPLDWNDPTGDTIELALIKKPASGGERLGSLFVNPGGPGGSAYDMVEQSADFAAHPEVQQSYDLIGYDPRGTGHSDAVRCLTDAERDAWLYDIIPGERGSKEWIEAYTKAAADFGAKCAENTGPLLEHIDTESTTRDLDMLRAAVGDTKLNYLGYSYGTFLGAIYADNFPDKVGRMVLDGAEDPRSSGFDITISQAAGFENALKSYLADCASRSDCWFDGSADSALTGIQKLLAQVDESPVRASDGRELGSSSLLTAIFYPLYNESSWPYLDTLFTSVADGQADYAFQLADAYNSRNPDGSYADNLIESFNAISCADYPAQTDPGVIAEQNEKLIEASPTVGPYWTFGDIGCAEWPYPSTRVPGPVTAAGSDPILVVGTTGDPATPYAWAEALADQLENGHLVTFEGEGHTAYNSSSCVAAVVDDYFLTGTVPASDPECTS